MKEKAQRKELARLEAMTIRNARQELIDVWGVTLDLVRYDDLIKVWIFSLLFLHLQ